MANALHCKLQMAFLNHKIKIMDEMFVQSCGFLMR